MNTSLHVGWYVSLQKALSNLKTDTARYHGLVLATMEWYELEWAMVY